MLCVMQGILSFERHQEGFVVSQKYKTIVLGFNETKEQEKSFRNKAKRYKTLHKGAPAVSGLL